MNRHRVSWKRVSMLLLALAFAPVIAHAQSTAATPTASPDSAETRRLIHALEGARAARVDVGPRSYVLLAPRGELDGLHWERLENWPPRRPAVFVSGRWDTIPPPPRPIPWEQIRVLERRADSHLPTTVFGAAIGAAFIGGLGYGFANLGGLSDAWSYGVGGMMIGGVAGGLMGAPFRSSTWVSEYPRDPRAARPPR